MAQLKNMKFRIANETESHKVQEKLFSLGYKWTASHDQEVQYTQSKFLFAYTDGAIGHSAFSFDQDYFERHHNPEVLVKDFLNDNYPRPHSDLIHAYADGAEIEVLVNGQWSFIDQPTFSPFNQYRIKPNVVYPVTDISGDVLEQSWLRNDDGAHGGFVRIANEVLKDFVESGKLAKYVAEHGVDGKGNK